MTSLAAQRKRLADSIMRNAIYDGVMEVLGEHGLAGATMDRIAATVGIAKGSLYNHFRGKDDLLEFVHERTIRPLLESTEQIAATDRTAADKIEAMIRNWQHRWRAPGDLPDLRQLQQRGRRLEAGDDRERIGRRPVDRGADHQGH